MLALALWALSAASMSDNITTAAAGKEVSKAVERERRNDRWAAAEQQPAATSSDSRAPSQKWRVRGFGQRPAGGKNTSLVTVSFGPFFAATQEAAEANRNKAIDDWLHEPYARPATKKQKTAEPEPEVGSGRAKRKAAPSDLTESRPTRGPRPDQAKAGSGCVARAWGNGDHTSTQIARCARSCTVCPALTPTCRAAPQARPFQGGGAAARRDGGLVAAPDQHDGQLA